MAIALPNNITRKRPPLCGLVLTAHSSITFSNLGFGAELKIRGKVDDGWTTIRTLSRQTTKSETINRNFRRYQ
jgi:hypothetical protein